MKIQYWFNLFSLVIALSALAFTIWGKLDSAALALPLPELTTALTGLIPLACFAIYKGYTPDYRCSSLSIFGLAVITFAVTRALFIPGSDAVNNELFLSFTPFHFTMIIGCALLGGISSWVIVPIILMGGEIGRSFVNVVLNGNDIGLWSENVTMILQNSIGTILLLFASGLFPALISFKQTNDGIEEVVIEPSEKEPLTPLPPPPPTSKLTYVDQSNASAATQLFTAEYIADIQNKADIEFKDLLDSVVFFMSRNFKAFSAIGFIYDSVNQCFVLNSSQSKSLHVVRGTTIPAGEGFVGKLASEPKSFMSGDISLYNAQVLYYKGTEPVNSILVVPIISETQELLGALVLDSKDRNAFRDLDKETLKRFSYLAAALIINSRMRIFQEQTARRFQVFYEVSHQLTTALNTQEVFEVLFRVIPLITNCFRLIAVLFQEESKTGIVYKVIGRGDDVPEGCEFPINSGLYSYAFQKRKLIKIGDYQQYQGKYYRFVPDEIQNTEIRSLIIFPIMDDELRCRGLFSIESDEINQFNSDIEKFLATLIDNASVAFTRALLYQRMEKLATTDGLTELNNHRHFQEMLNKELERARRYNRTVGLLLMDIDHFKSFNDTYGHPVGDLVLKEIAQCIRKSIRINDIPARYGGEEFAVIIPEVDDRTGFLIAERIRTTIERHIIRSLDRELRVTVSIGCAVFPATATTQADLIQSADKSLYFSKEHGRNKVTLFNQI